MILIKKSQLIKNSTVQIKKDAQKLLELLGYSDFDVGILLTTNKIIQKYNKKFRKKDKPTDILSFPYHIDLKAGSTIAPKTEEDKNLGDIVISIEHVKKDATLLEIPFEQHLQKILVHGICHLLGYDHQAEADYKKMYQKEQKLLNELKNNTHPL